MRYLGIPVPKSLFLSAPLSKLKRLVADLSLDKHILGGDVESRLADAHLPADIRHRGAPVDLPQRKAICSPVNRDRSIVLVSLGPAPLSIIECECGTVSAAQRFQKFKRA